MNVNEIQPLSLEELRLIVYRLENKLLQAEQRIAKLEAADKATAALLNRISLCDTCD